MYSCCKNFANIELAGASGIGDWQLAVKSAGKKSGNIDGQREQRATGHIHLISRQRTFVVDGAEGIGELHTEAEMSLFCQLHQAFQHF